MTQIVTELVVDARGAKAGTAEYIQAMNAAQRAADATIESYRRASESQDKQVTAMTGGSQSIQRIARDYEKLQRVIDPVSAAQKKLEQATVTVDAAVKRGIATQAQASATLARYKREVDGTAAAEARFARDLENVRTSLDRQYGSAQRLAQQQEILNRALRNGSISFSDHQRAIGEANRQYQTAIGTQQQAASSMGTLIGLARQLAPVLGAAFVVRQIQQFVGEMVQAADMVARIEGRFQALTGSSVQAAAAVQQVFAISQQTGVAIEQSGQAFTRFFIASRSIGATQAEAARLTETIQKFGIIGGASMQEVTAGSIQLGQALASGQLRGDEFRSVMENLPLVARAISDSLGVGVGQLREMAAQGELTAEKVFGALIQKSGEADKMFAAMPVTVERAAGQASVAWTKFLASLDETLRISRILATTLQGIAQLLSGSGPARTSAMFVDDLRRKIAEYEARANMAGGWPGLPGIATRQQETLRGLREALDLALEGARREQELTVHRNAAEASIAAKTKATNAATAAEKKHVEAMAEMEKVLQRLDPGRKAAADFSETVMVLDEALAAGSISAADHARFVGLAAKAYDEATKKAGGKAKAVRELKITYDSLNPSIKAATQSALDHEERMRSGSKAVEAILKADKDYADQLTRQFIPAQDKANELLARYDRLLSQGHITPETYAAAVEKVNRELRDQDPAFREAEDAARRFQEQLDRNIQAATDRIVDFGADELFNILTGKSENFWETFRDLGIRALAQLAAEALLRPIAVAVATPAVGLPMQFFPDDTEAMKEAA